MSELTNRGTAWKGAWTPLSPSYLDELQQIRDAVRIDKQWYDDELKKLEAEMHKKRCALSREYMRRTALHSSAEDFIREHPSQAELERQACIEQLIQSGAWILCDQPRRLRGPCYYLVISQVGFPTTIFKAASLHGRNTASDAGAGAKPDIPLVTQNLTQNYDFSVSIGFKEREPDGPP
jgi:hypothetical protein